MLIVFLSWVKFGGFFEGLLVTKDLSPAVLTLVMNTQGSCLKLPSELPSILASSGPSSAGLFHLPSRLLGQSVQR